MTRRTGTIDRTRPDTPSYHCKSTARGAGTPRLAAPTHPDRAGADWQLSITRVCLEGELQ
jgi:hypothetical protein